MTNKRTYTHKIKVVSEHWPGLALVHMLSDCESKHAVGGTVSQRSRRHVHVEGARGSAGDRQGPHDLE